MISKIKTVINNYSSTCVRSEEEVRSKLIVPLIEALGYEAYLRGEAFPVYTNHGCKQETTTIADFVLFDDADFNNHAKNSDDDLAWVYDHSLLVIEAKRPGEFPKTQNQVRFYTLWTRALAYIVTDGKHLKAWLFKASCSDELIVDCELGINADFDQLVRFSFSSLSELKDSARSYERYRIITDPSEIKLPDEQYNYMRSALGRNADNLNNLELLSKYLNTCDYILQNNIRYDISPLAMDLLRANYKAYFFLDNEIAPVAVGEIFYSYWDDFDEYQFSCETIRVCLRYYKNELSGFGFIYNSETSLVADRISEIACIINILKSKRFIIEYTDEENQRKQLSVLHSNNKNCVNNTKECLEFYTIWLEKLEQLKSIEIKYNVVFDYRQELNSVELFEAIDSVYNGFNMIENCVLTINCKGMKSFEFEVPTILNDSEITNIHDKDLFGIVFHPIRTYALPGKYNISLFKKKIDLSICCEYDLLGEG